MELIYKNLKGTLEKLTVTDEEVDRQLTKNLSANLLAKLCSVAVCFFACLC